ncbi:MAG: HIT domain-containing protein [Verrucomicrobiota bacterium]
MALIQERVDLANEGKNDKVICRLRSGWVVIGDVQPLRGYCLLLSDPVVPTVNDLPMEKRIEFLKEMTIVGEAIQKVVGAKRMNYEILGNAEPELHAHIFPRFEDEPEELKRMPPFFYDWNTAPPYSERLHGDLRISIQEELLACAHNPLQSGQTNCCV